MVYDGRIIKLSLPGKKNKELMVLKLNIRMQFRTQRHTSSARWFSHLHRRAPTRRIEGQKRGRGIPGCGHGLAAAVHHAEYRPHHLLAPDWQGEERGDGGSGRRSTKFPKVHCEEYCMCETFDSAWMTDTMCSDRCTHMRKGRAE